MSAAKRKGDGFERDVARVFREHARALAIARARNIRDAIHIARANARDTAEFSTHPT